MKRDDCAIAAAVQKAAEGILADELKLLERLCSYDCPTFDEAGNAKIVQVVDEALKTIKGIVIEHVCAPGDGVHVMGRLTPEHPTGRSILNAHLDTVLRNTSVADLPFRIEGDMAYGLGSGDCKGGVVVAITAVRLAQQLGLLPNKEIFLMFNCEEETTATDSGCRFFDLALPAPMSTSIFHRW